MAGTRVKVRSGVNAWLIPKTPTLVRIALPKRIVRHAQSGYVEVEIVLEVGDQP